MSERVFDRETLLDLTVNVIPLGIILFFVVVFLLITPWRPDPFTQLISMGLLVVPFVALAFLTYISGRAIAQDEEKEEDATDVDHSFDDPTAAESKTETGTGTEMADDEAAALEAGETKAEETDNAEQGAADTDDANGERSSGNDDSDGEN